MEVVNVSLSGLKVVIQVHKLKVSISLNTLLTKACETAGVLVKPKSMTGALVKPKGMTR